MGAGTELQGRRILIVEDDFFVAQALWGLIEEAGATVVGPIGWLGEALAYVESSKYQFDSAIIDVDLHGEKSFALADWLAEHNVHFVFTTGYGAEALGPAYAGYARCEKPIDPRMLFRALASRSPGP